MSSKHEGPFVRAFDTEPTGVVKQELITYRVKNGMLRKEVATREYNKDQTDWQDSACIQPLYKVT
tara:strand:+ start:1123 stop:1317 length:195 start_codon:yes stop_codon:yes gene_type:complete